VCGEDWYLRVWHCKDCGYVRKNSISFHSREVTMS
jgi:hypothetical protein